MKHPPRLSLAGKRRHTGYVTPASENPPMLVTSQPLPRLLLVSASSSCRLLRRLHLITAHRFYGRRPVFAVTASHTRGAVVTTKILTLISFRRFPSSLFLMLGGSEGGAVASPDIIIRISVLLGSKETPNSLSLRFFGFSSFHLVPGFQSSKR